METITLSPFAEYGLPGLIIGVLMITTTYLIRYLIRKQDEERKYYQSQIQKMADEHQSETEIMRLEGRKSIQELIERNHEYNEKKDFQHQKTLEMISTHHDHQYQRISEDFTKSLADLSGSIHEVVEELKDMRQEHRSLRTDLAYLKGQVAPLVAKKS